MSWQLLVPIAEKLLDAGVEYYKSSANTQGAVAATPPIASNSKGASILVTVEAISSTATVTEETLLAALEDMAVKNGLKLTTANINIDEEESAVGA